MGKGKLNMLDVRAIIKELRHKLIGLRLANLYNLNNKTYLLKFSGHIVGINEHKETDAIKQQLIIESGVRIHTTAYSREHDKLPSNFAVKLRKHIRLLRLENIQQLGVDRVIDLQFGHDSKAYHILLELYAQGNVILTNHLYEIIMVLRVHNYEDSNETAQQNSTETGEDNNAAVNINSSSAPFATESSRVAVRSVYPFKFAQTSTATVTKPLLSQIFDKQRLKQKEDEDKLLQEEKEMNTEATTAAEAPTETAPTQVVAKQGKKKGKLITVQPMKDKSAANKRNKVRTPPIKSLLAPELQYGPDIVEHCLLKAGIDPNFSIDFDAVEENEQLIEKLVEAFTEAPKLLEKVSSQPLPGYIVVRTESSQDNNQQNKKNKTKKTKPKKTTEGDVVPEENNNTEENKAEHQQANSVSKADVIKLAESLQSTHIDSKPAASEQKSAIAGSVELYSEYLSIMLAQHDQSNSTSPYCSSKCRIIEFPSFDAALDEFYSKQEEQKEALRLVKEKAAALAKIDRVKQSHQHQLDALEKQQAENIFKAQLIESNKIVIDKTIEVVNTELAKGIDWAELNNLIKEQKKNSNPLALLIHALKLHQNSITINLSPDCRHLLPQFSSDPQYKPVKVDIQLNQTAYANAQLYYQQQKKQSAKQAKTVHASQKALKAAEKKTAQQLHAVDLKAKIQRLRKIHWFEKFHWFITAENYLVIGGKDAQQNEALVKKQLRKGDIYIHAEVPGASSVIVKNPSGQAIPSATINAAGSMTICRSAAWNNKVQVESYWVNHDQVSKTAPTGLYLTTGSFMIRGQKNFIKREALVMGLGLLFRLDESSRAKHAGERRARTLANEVEEEKSAASLDPKELAKQKKADMIAEANRRHAQLDEDFDVTTKFVLGKKSSTATSIKQIKKEESHQVSNKEEKTESTRGSNANPADPLTESNENRDGKKRLTVAERKKLKKQGAKPAEPNSSPSNLPADASAAPTASAEQTNTDVGANQNQNHKKNKSNFAAASALSDSEADGAKQNKSQPLPRGKRNKMKKIAKKYAEQDENDLELASKLLGLQNVEKKRQEIASKKQPQTNSKAKEAKQAEETAQPEVEAQSAVDATTSSAVDSSIVCLLCKQSGHIYKNCPLKVSSDDLSFAQAKKAAQKLADEEIAELMHEEGVAEDAAVANFDTNQLTAELDELTGKPLADDILQYCIAVVAPYSALSDYKYKIKFTPGTQKRGTAGKTAIHYFLAQAQSMNASQQEKELIKSIPDNDILQVLLSNIKLSAPGLNEAKSKANQAKRASKPSVKEVSAALKVEE
jgi:predicted ribosome quality control (RQC) complex YloA/Tae2 family protein